MNHDKNQQQNAMNYEFDNIPQELKRLHRWTLWREEVRNGKPTKVPYQARGVKADSSNPSTWIMYPNGIGQMDAFDGIGFFLGDGYCGIDIDGYELDDPFVVQAVKRFASYTEISPSGRGVHIIVKGEKPSQDRSKNPKTGVEIYDQRRYFTMTGNLFHPALTRIESRQETLAEFYYEQFPPEQKETPQKNASGDIPKDDQELLDLARSARNGAKFRKLFDDGDDSDYESPSEADAALCEILAFWTGKDFGRIERLFSQSALNRDKWADRADYRKWTIDFAIGKCGDVYQGKRKQAQKADKAADDGRQAKDTSWITQIEYTDGWRAKYLCNQFGADIRWIDEWGKWLIWDGKRFEIDRTRKIEYLAKQTVADMLREAALRVERGDNAKELIEQAKKADSHAKYTAMINLAKSEPEIPIVSEQLDTDPMLFNVLNGTVNLRTGELKEHLRVDHITKLAPVHYRDKATCPEWMAFLSKIMDDDEELITFLQRAVGYSLTGEIREQILLIMYGIGANGKTTFIEAIKGLMGDYAKDCEPDLIVQRKHEAHPAGLADLMGARFVSTTEIGENVRLNEALIKRLTGGDTIKARFMRQDWFEFQPTHTLWIAVNHKPNIKGTDTGIWRRPKLIPFEVTIPDSEQIPLAQMLETFKRERSGILNWAIEGCLEWQTDGLGLPAKIYEATKAYREEMDVVGRFIDDYCILRNTAIARSGQLYKAYQEWCESNGEFAQSNKKLSQNLVEKGYEKDRDDQSVFFKGIGLAYQPP